MGKKADIEKEVKELLAPGEYDIRDSDVIPGPGDNRLTFKNTGVRFHASVLYIDMRGSTAVLNNHRPYSVAKMLKAYLYTATTLIAAAGGQIRSYNGDSILAFFPHDYKETIEKAVRTAMQITYMLTQVSAQEFKRYTPLDFGIGIDHGKILCVKAGRARNDNHNDLIWLGNPVNRAVVLSDKARATDHIWISNACRINLLDSVMLSEGKDMWKKQSFEYNAAQEEGWSTDYHWSVA